MRTPIWKHCHTGVGRVEPVPKDQSGEAAGLASKVLVGGKSLEKENNWFYTVSISRDDTRHKGAWPLSSLITTYLLFIISRSMVL